MSFNGSGTFVVNSAGQPVVANTVISATVFNALTADLATGLSTCITKDGQTTVTANIPFGNNKITALGAGTAASDAANLGQVQSTAAKLVTVTGTDTITGTMSPALTAYAAGQLFYFIANAANTGAVTINIDGLGAKSITRDGSTALAGGDINSGEFVVIIYDGTRFQMINAANSFGNTTINGTLTVTGNTALQANVSITSTLSVGGTFAVTGAATLGSTLAVTGKSDLPTVSTASINAAVALITTGTVTNLTATGASIASANIGNLQFTAASIASINAGVAVVTNLTATSASIASMNAGVALVTTATITGLTATGASVASANVGTAVVTGLTVTGASIASVNAGVAVLSGNLTLNGGTANGVLYLNGSKVATSGSALVFDGTNLGIGTASPANALEIARGAGVAGGVSLRGNGNSAAAEFFVGQGSGSDAFLYNRANATMIFGTNNATRMTLTAAGDLGIGTTSPDSKLDVRNTGGTYDKGITLQTVSAGNIGTFWTSTTDLNIGIAGAHKFTNYDGSATRMTLDSSGNLGLGVTPATWFSGSKAIQFGAFGSIEGRTSAVRTVYATNSYLNASGNNTYIGTGAATAYIQDAGTHAWSYAASGTAGNAITFTQAMTLDSSGRLLIGATSSQGNGSRLQISGSTQYFGSQSANGLLSSTSYFNTNSTGFEIAKLDVSTGANIYEGIFQFYTKDSGGTMAERARIDSSGNLGIGTTSPSSKLVVKTGTNENLEVRSYSAIMGTGSGVALDSLNDARTSVVDWVVRGTNIALYGSGSTPMTFYTNSTERARITAAGEFLVGTTDITPNAGIGVKVIPAGQLHLVSSASTTSLDGFTMYSTGASAYRFYVQWNGTINATNTTITGISDQRLKENIQDLDDGLDAILALKPRKFDWKAGKGKDIKGDRGWIAQEFEQVFPDMISEWKEPAPEGEEPYKAVRADLIPVLVKAMQEQQAMIEELKAKVAQLEAR